MLLHSKNDRKIKELLKRHELLEEDLIQLFKKDDNEDVRDTEEIKLESLENVVKEMKLLNNIDGDLIDFNNLSIVSDIKINDKVLNSYNLLKKEIDFLIKHIDKVKTPTLDLNLIISFLNLFRETFVDIDKIENEMEEIKEPIILLCNTDKKIPLVLQDDKKIVLTNRNFDLSSFTYDELIEILRVLDVIIQDNSFDNIRAEISKHISSISTTSITPLK